MPRLEPYLETLAREARGTMSATETVAFVTEAREHLEASIQARLELGMSSEEAEREALASFGAAQAIGQEVRRREPRFDRTFTLAFLGAVSTIFWMGNVSTNGLASVLAFAAYAVLHVALIVTSFRVRRPQWVVFMAVLLPLWLGAATLGSMAEVTVFYSDRPGEGERGTRVLRAETARQAKAFDEAAERLTSRSDALLGAYTRYMKGESDLSVYDGPLFDAQGRLQLKPQPDRTLGEAAWKASVPLWMHAVPASSQEQWRCARLTEAAAERPWWQELPYQFGPALERTQVLPLLGVYGGGHLLLWAIGAWSRRRQGPQRPPTIA